MATGKHASTDDFEFNFKPIIIILVIVLVIFLSIKFIIPEVTKYIGKKSSNNIEQVSNESSEMLEEIEGYEVLGKISIDKINIEQYILNSTEDTALANGAGKLYGGDLNSNGNLCIAGHNYENIFQNLKELEVGDIFYIIDRNFEKTSYRIKDIYSVEPNDLQCLMQNNDLIEVTLITCESGATSRLIVKAEKTVDLSESSNINEIDDSNNNETANL